MSALEDEQSINLALHLVGEANFHAAMLQLFICKKISVMRRYSINTERIYSFLLIVFSVSYAALLSGLPVDRFVDRANYLDFVTNPAVLLEKNLSSRLITLLQNEPVWF